jgi:hypothetical protein
MMHRVRSSVGADHQHLSAALHEHGANSRLMKFGATFVEKRTANFKGWDNAADCYRLSKLKKS